MSAAGRVHDRELIDSLESLGGGSLQADVWRVVRSGREPLRGAVANGRWGAADEFEVLYTARERDGALAEVGYRLGLEPIWPSKLSHELCALTVALDNVLDLADFGRLGRLGIDEGGYEGHDYRATQAISAAARFVGFQAILVPNARFAGTNLVLYPDATGGVDGLSCTSSQDVDWNIWRASNRQRPSRARSIKEPSIRLS